MTKNLYVFLFTFLAVLGELLMETAGFKLMLLAPLVFYITYVFGYISGLSAALMGGCVLDFCFGAPNPWTAFSLLLVVGFAVLWLRQTESNSISLLVIPGAILPFIALFPPAFINGGFTLRSFLDAGADSVISALLAVVLFPLAVMLLDFIGASLSLELFADAKERQRNKLR